MRRSIVALCGCGLLLVACATARTYWYNPDLAALWERDHQRSQAEARQVRVTSLGPMEQPVFTPNLHQSFGQNLLRGLGQYSAALQQATERAQQRAYDEAMARRGWRRIHYEEAVARGLVKPN